MDTGANKTGHEIPFSVDADSLTTDDELEILAHPYRRHVLRFLQKARGPVSVERLAMELVTRESGVALDKVTSEAQQRVHIALYHNHLPKMDDYGLVEYDRESAQVTLVTGVRIIDEPPVSIEDLHV